MSTFQGLYNQYTGTFDDAIIENAIITNANITTETVGSSNITNAIIASETVNSSIITTLKVTNIAYFEDGTVLAPSIAFANDHGLGLYKYTTHELGFADNGVLVALITPSGLVSVFNVQAGSQFLCNSSSVSAPSYSFVGDTTTGLYESASGEISISSSGNQVIKFNSSLITALVSIICGALSTTSITNSGTSTLTGAVSCGALTSMGNISNGTNAMTTGTLSTSSINNSGTMSSGAITSTGNFSNGTNAMTTGALSTSSINNSGTMSSGAITSTGNFNNGTNSMTTSALSTSSINNSGTSTLTGAVSCGAITSTGNFNNGTNNMTTSALSTSSINNSGTMSSGAITSTGTFNNGTNSMTTGALSSSSINNSGSLSTTSITLTGALTNSVPYFNASKVLGTTQLTNGQLLIGNTGNPPSTNTISGTTNQLNVTNGAGTITLSTPQNIDSTATPTFSGLVANTSYNPFLITSNVGSTTNGFTSLFVAATSPSGGNLYGIGVSKFGYDAIMMGVNKNTTTNQLPATCTYISAYNTNSTLSVGRGNGTGLPDYADILIDSNGAITLTNNIFVIRESLSSLSIGGTGPSTYTNWDTSITNQGNTTYSTGVWTIGTAGIYQCSFDICWAANTTGYREAFISATAGVFASSIINSPPNINLPQSGSASIKCSIGDTVSLSVYQTSGSTLSIQAISGFQVRFTIAKIQ